MRLFVWLVKRNKREFITYADEEDAQGRLRKYLQCERSAPVTTPRLRTIQEQPRDLADDEKAVEMYLQLTSNQAAASAAAQKLRGWTQDRWESAYASYTTKQAQLWMQDED